MTSEDLATLREAALIGLSAIPPGGMVFGPIEWVETDAYVSAVASVVLSPRYGHPAPPRARVAIVRVLDAREPVAHTMILDAREAALVEPALRFARDIIAEETR